MAAQQGDDPVDAATRRLYAVSPDDFMATRKALAGELRSSGDAAAAAQVEKLRKPTVAAWIVNAFVLDDAGAVGRLAEMGDRLRAAQERLDAGELRALTPERRELVSALTQEAVSKAHLKKPPAGIYDEVSGTFDAALADPEIAARLGRLVRAERWSGFGFLPSGAPALTVVRGGKDTAPEPAAKDKRAPKKTAAQRRKEQQAIDDAQYALDRAEEALEEAELGERQLTDRVRELTQRLAEMQNELEQVRVGLEASKKNAVAAKKRRREARAKLVSAERAARD